MEIDHSIIVEVETGIDGTQLREGHDDTDAVVLFTVYLYRRGRRFGVSCSFHRPEILDIEVSKALTHLPQHRCQ